MSGIIKSISRTNDDDGREVLRVIIDYRNGDAPDVKFGDVWGQTPVEIVIAKATGQGSGA